MEVLKIILLVIALIALVLAIIATILLIAMIIDEWFGFNWVKEKVEVREHWATPHEVENIEELKLIKAKKITKGLYEMVSVNGSFSEDELINYIKKNI